MSVPKSVVRFKRGGVEYTSSVDRAAYTILELTRAALRDVGKYIVRKANSKAAKLHGMTSRKKPGKTGTPSKATYTGLNKRIRGTTSTFLYDVPWVKSIWKSPHLEVGVVDDTWYGVEQELGSSKMKKHGFLTKSAQENIAQIIEIESKYLSALEDEAKALRLISDEEYSGGGDD